MTPSRTNSVLRALAILGCCALAVAPAALAYYLPTRDASASVADRYAASMPQQAESAYASPVSAVAAGPGGSVTSLPALIVPTRSGAAQLAAFPFPGSGIKYNMGRRVLTGKVAIYNIFYGKWSKEQVAIVEDFVSGLHATKWWGIMKGYYYQKDASSPKEYVGDDVRLAKSVYDSYSKGTSLSGNDIPSIIQRLVDTGALPEDENAIYVFLSSGDVKEKIRSDLGNAQFCQAYCGYHVSWQLRSGKRVFYAMVGVPSTCLNGCAGPHAKTVSINSDPGVDSMISALAHEIVEAVSDPWSDNNAQRAWEDGSHMENGDKCAWKFGPVSKDEKSGAEYNIEFGGRRFLVQENWDPVTQACSQGVDA